MKKTKKKTKNKVKVKVKKCPCCGWLMWLSKIEFPGWLACEMCDYIEEIKDGVSV